MTPAPQRRAADVVEEHRQEVRAEFDRDRARIALVEEGLLGTPTTPGLLAKVELLKLDMDSKLTRLADKMTLNNWLTGAIGAILVTQAIYNVLKG